MKFQNLEISLYIFEDLVKSSTYLMELCIFSLNN